MDILHRPKKYISPAVRFFHLKAESSILSAAIETGTEGGEHDWDDPQNIPEP